MARTLLDAEQLQRAIADLSRQILARNPTGRQFGLVGLPTRGFVLAQRLSGLLYQATGVPFPVGKMDITFHRDDFEWHRTVPHVTNIPFDTSGRVIILVDDVIFTGRTVRAALNALGDFGRPAAIQLAALVDRGHRQLPIQADFVGERITTNLGDSVQVKLMETDQIDLVELEEQSSGN